MTYNLNIDDYIGRWGYSKQYVRNQLAGLKGKPVNVRISSLGGAVDDGLDIRQQFVDHGNVTAYLYGLVASSATIAALGAKKVCISRYCLFLVHKVSNWVDAWGQYNADQIQQLIDELKENKLQNDKFDLVLANMYAAKCNKKVDDILDVLKAGRWLTAQEALEYGFVDEIIEGDEDKLNLAAYEGKVNMLGLSPLPVASGSERDTADSHKLLNKILTKLDGLFSSARRGAPNVKLRARPNAPRATKPRGDPVEAAGEAECGREGGAAARLQSQRKAARARSAPAPLGSRARASRQSA